MNIQSGGNVVRRVTHESWGSRIKGAIFGVLFGLLFLLAAAVILFTNEGRAVRRAQALKEGAAVVQPLSTTVPDGGREGQLVHFSGVAETDESLVDPVLGVQATAIRLTRGVEMFQWQESSHTEEKKKLGGGTEKVTTYSYERGWANRPISSASFEEPSGHQNPPFPIAEETWTASNVRVGGFTLTDTFKRKLGKSQPLAVDQSVADAAQRRFERPVRVTNGALFAGADPSTPKVGDVRVRFTVVSPAEVSIVGRQVGNQVDAYPTKSGSPIALLQYGRASADEMFASARTSNRVLTWVLRLAGFGVFFLGFGLILRPARVLADVVPAIGRLVGAGVGFVSFGLAAISTLVVVAVGWMFYRPLLAAVLFALALGVVVWMLRRSRRARAAKVPDLPPLPTS